MEKDQEHRSNTPNIIFYGAVEYLIESTLNNADIYQKELI
jgi:hypothetical protein